MNDYTYVRVSELNFVDLINLIRLVYGIDVDIAQFKQKYNTDSFGASYVGYFAYYKDSQTVAAYYGIIPVKVNINKTSIMAAQSADTMTHPDHRNKGLFIELAKLTYQLGKSLGVQFVFGFPKKNAAPGLIKQLGWTYASDMVSVNIIVPTIPYSELVIRNATLKTWHSRVLIRLLEKLFETPEKIPGEILLNANLNNGVVHDMDFLKYKLGFNRILLKHNSVYLLLKVESNCLGIGALFNYKDNSDVKQIMRKLKFICILLGITKIRTYCSSTKLAGNIFKKYGFSKKSLPYCYINFSGPENDIHNLELTYLDYNTF